MLARAKSTPEHAATHADPHQHPAPPGGGGPRKEERPGRRSRLDHHARHQRRDVAWGLPGWASGSYTMQMEAGLCAEADDRPAGRPRGSRTRDAIRAKSAKINELRRARQQTNITKRRGAQMGRHQIGPAGRGRSPAGRRKSPERTTPAPSSPRPRGRGGIARGDRTAHRRGQQFKGNRSPRSRPSSCPASRPAR